MAEGYLPKNFFKTIGVKDLTIPANTETVITDDITIPQSGIYFIGLALGGIDTQTNRAIKIYRRNDNYVILATYMGEYNYIARVIDLYPNNQIYATIKTSNSLRLYTDSRYNSLSVIQIA